MSPGPILKRVVVDRLEWIRRMVDEIRALPLQGHAVRGLPRGPGDAPAVTDDEDASDEQEFGVVLR